jgi:exopolysaccharide biosynthesis polyprenyl glycosylphosphotransferase
MNQDRVGITEQTAEQVRAGKIRERETSAKLIHYLLPLLYIVGDIAGIYLSFLLAYELRFNSGLVGSIFPVTWGTPSLSIYLYALIFVCGVWLFIFALFGHYKRRSPSMYDRFYETLRGVASGTFLILASTFFYRGESFSRLVLAVACGISVILIWSLRETIYRLEKWYLKRGVISKRAVIVGACEKGVELFKKLTAQPAWGIVPLGFASDQAMPHPILGKPAELDDIIKTHSIEMVIFNLPHESQDFITDFVMKSENLKLEYMLSPDMMGLMIFNAEAGQIEGIPVIRWGKTPIEGYARAVKRIFDTIFSGIGIALSAPLMAVIAVAVKLDSPGPVFFRQRRVGRNGKEFTIYKFRSMRTDRNDSNGSGWTVKDDPRRTKTGKVIRKYNLDELPQLFNVFKGQMSLVGPRPEQPGYVEKFRDDIPRYFQRHKVKSGVTGWAQVNGFRGDTSIAERTKYDLYYVENWSLTFDIKIIFLTLKNIFKSPNAY